MEKKDTSRFPLLSFQRLSRGIIQLSDNQAIRSLTNFGSFSLINLRSSPK